MKILKGVLFWALSLSWGCLMTAYGIVVAAGLLLSGRRPHRFHFYIWFEAGKNWGGFECGPFFVVNENPSEQIKRHEAGHGLQNILFGPLTPFLVSIPSAVRYWSRRIAKKRGQTKFPPYDAVWFEAQATRWGERFFS